MSQAHRALVSRGRADGSGRMARHRQA
jgi:hypothetical protein